jgi:hypothetical protein
LTEGQISRQEGLLELKRWGKVLDGQMDGNQTAPSQAKPSQAKPSQAKPSQAKPSQAIHAELGICGRPIFRRRSD